MNTSTNQLHPVHQTHDGKFNTFTKAKIDLHHITDADICIEDIAHGLSNICRFGGQTPEFYSVAQHSVLVWSLCPITTHHEENERIRKVALLHDASEAYLGDVIKPLKNILGKAYTDIEFRFCLAIAERFGLICNQFADIKQYDKQALEIEHEYFFRGTGPFESYFRGYDDKGNYCWTPTEAKARFMWAFNETF